MTEHYRQKAAPANPSSRAAKKAKSAAAPKQQALQGTAEAPAEEPAEAPTEEEPAEEPTEEELPRKAEGRIVDLSADRLLLWYPLEEQLGAERVYDATEVASLEGQRPLLATHASPLCDSTDSRRWSRGQRR